MLDVEKMIDGIHDYLARSLRPFAERIKALEDRQPAKGEKGDPGQPGKDADLSEIAAKAAAHVETLFSEYKRSQPIPRDGRDGRDGVSVETVAKLVSAEVTKAVAELPKPADGKDGAPGTAGKDGASVDFDAVVQTAVKMIPVPKDGTPGPKGEPGVTNIVNAFDPSVIAEYLKSSASEEIIVGMLRPSIARDVRTAVENTVAQIPKPRDGDQGPPPDFETVKLAVAAMAPPVIEQHFELAKAAFAERADSYLKGLVIPRGEPGQDGKSVDMSTVDALFQAATARWELDMERRAAEVFQKAIDRMPVPKDGANGRDGIDWETFDADLDEDGRTLVVSLGNGDQKVVKRIKTSIPVFRGSWKASDSYQKGDCVNWGGNMWIARKDTNARPTGGDDPNWQMAVRRGADAKVS